MNLALTLVVDLADALALAPLLEQHARDPLAELGRTPLAAGAVRAFLERAFGERETALLVAREAGAARALCLTAAIESPLTRERLPCIAVLWVAPEFRHRGVARALVDEAQRVLAARGCRTLAARAVHNDDALISMGERFGFVREVEIMVRDA